MGCGFSADDSKASDEEGILDKNTSKLNKGSASQSNSNGSISGRYLSFLELLLTLGIGSSHDITFKLTSRYSNIHIQILYQDT